MQILAIDTASSLCSAALFVQGLCYERSRLVPQGHGQWILPMVDGLLDEANTTLQDLDGIAFGRGPGTFTGVRMATAVAQGLGLGAKVPLLPVSNLAMLAQGARRLYQAEKTVVAIDARMNEVYWASYEVSDQGLKEVGPESLCQPDRIPELVGNDWIGIGTGFAEYPGIAECYGEQLQRIDSECLPRAEDALPIAIAMLEEGRALTPEKAAPVYLRDEVAWR